MSKLYDEHQKINHQTKHIHINCFFFLFFCPHINFRFFCSLLYLCTARLTAKFPNNLTFAVFRSSVSPLFGVLRRAVNDATRKAAETFAHWWTFRPNLIASSVVGLLLENFLIKISSLSEFSKWCLRAYFKRTSQLARNSLRFKAPMSSDLLSSAENFEHLGAHKRSLMNWMNLNELRSVRSTCSLLRRTRFEAASGDLIHCGMSISLFIIFLISLGRFSASLEKKEQNSLLFFFSSFFSYSHEVRCLTSSSASPPSSFFFLFRRSREHGRNMDNEQKHNKAESWRRAQRDSSFVCLCYQRTLDEASWGPTKQTHTKIH